MVRQRSQRGSGVLCLYLRQSSKIKNITTLHNTPSGSVDMVTFELLGQEFQAISAGPLFKFNPSVSFHVTCNTKDEVDAIWERLSQGGKVLMELGAYPFSERYGWVQDKYGLSWQIYFYRWSGRKTEDHSGDHVRGQRMRQGGRGSQFLDIGVSRSESRYDPALTARARSRIRRVR